MKTVRDLINFYRSFTVVPRSFSLLKYKLCLTYFCTMIGLIEESSRSNQYFCFNEPVHVKILSSYPWWNYDEYRSHLQTNPRLNKTVISMSLRTTHSTPDTLSVDIKVLNTGLVALSTWTVFISTSSATHLVLIVFLNSTNTL